MKIKKYMILAAGILAVTSALVTAENKQKITQEAEVKATEAYSSLLPFSEKTSAYSSIMESDKTRKIKTTAEKKEKIYVKAPEQTDEIIELYAAAVNNVKKSRPGYIKKEYQKLTDVKLNGADNKILKYADEFITDESEAKPITVQKGSRQSSDYFPLYNSSNGCVLKDFSAVKKAECSVNNGVYSVFIEMNPSSNPDFESSPLAQIMTPINPEMIEGLLNDKRVKRFLKSYSYRLDYRNCYLKADIDSNGKLLSLVQVMNCDVSAEGTLKPFDKKISASGRVTDVAEFYSFKY